MANTRNMKNFICCILSLCFPFLLHAQEKNSSCNHNHRSKLAKTTVAHPEEENYDISYLKFDLNMSNTSNNIQGSVTTRAKVLVPNFNTYFFELDPAHIIDSVIINSQSLQVTTTGSLRSVALPLPLPVNSFFTAEVYYRGAAPLGTGFFTAGIIKTTQGSNQILYSLSDRFLAKDWWPCKQSLTDKVDSADIWITVPPAVKVGSNGKLLQVKPINGNFRYEWKSRYPIEYYLISVAIAPFADYSYYAHYTSSSDSTLVQNYILDSSAFFPANKPFVDTTGLVMGYFSDLFGRYPFWQEKYGQCFVPLSGGMENQTMSDIGQVSTTLMAHELGHQWWGNSVTYKSWRDIWLSEGFATYCEHLYLEKYHNAQAARTFRDSRFNNIISAPGGSVFVDDTTNDLRVFDGRLTYNKGAAVVHMLRYISPSDAIFFNALKNFQTQNKYGLANTEEFKLSMQTSMGINLDTFFSQWVYGQGFPTYSARWAQYNDTILIRIAQTASLPTAISSFATPLEIRLQSLSGDTIVKVYSRDTAEFFRFKWGRQMGGLTFDPNNHILNKQGAVTNDQHLSIDFISPRNLNIYPNPTDNFWIVRELGINSDLMLTDNLGKTAWKAKNENEFIKIDATGFAPGIYHLTIGEAGQPEKTISLIKK